MRKLLLYSLLSLISSWSLAQSVIYYEDFEGATAQTYTGNAGIVTINGLTGWEFETQVPGGALQTDIVANSGVRSMGMYEASGSTEPENSLILTYDMSAYSINDSLEMDFFILHNNDEDDDHDRIWIRGSNSDPWIEVFDLDPFLNSGNDNEWLPISIDLDEFIEANGQTFTATFQARFGQQDNVSWVGNDGIAYDDVTLQVYEYGVNQTNANDFVCFNATDGFIAVEAVLGTAPYTYAWSNGSTGDSIGGLQPGTYCVTATDDNGDTVSNCFDIVGGDSIYVDGTVTSPLICEYDISEAQAVGSGGFAFTGSYAMDTNSANYSWDTNACNAVTFASFSNEVSTPLPIGFDFEFYGQSYDEFQIATNGYIGFGGSLDDGCCSAEPLPDPSTFEPNNAIFASWFDVDGATEYTYCTVGEAPFRKLVVSFVGLGDCGGDNNVNAQIVLHEGSNCIEIHTDFLELNGCLNTFDDITQGIQNEGGTEASVYPGRNAENWETDDSYIQFCPVDTSGLLYTWSSGDFGTEVIGLDPGTYTVSATDAQGCSAVDTVEVDAPASSLSLSAEVVNVSCFGFGDGEVQITETGGVGLPSYAWSNGETTQSLTNVDEGMYSVTATDNLGCMDSLQGIYVDESDLLISSIYDVIHPECPSDETGSASAAASGGRAPYTYEWSNGQMSQDATNLMDAAYLVTVTDSSGCESVESVNIIAQNSAPVVDLGPDVYNQLGGSVILSAGNSGIVQWSTQEITSTIAVTSTDTYWALVTNTAGCSSSDTVYVEIWPTGIEDVNTGAGLAMYPNPTNGQMTLKLQTAEGWSDVQINITDLQGRVVATRALQRMEPNQGVTLDVTNLTPGVYNLNVITDDNVVKQSFVKQ